MTNDKNLSYKLGLGPFTDLTGEEFMQMFNNLPERNEDLSNLSKLNEKTTVELKKTDWTYLYGRVKDQGYCQACYIFAAIGVLEGILAQKYNYVSLSEQHLIDCSSETSCKNGGFVESALSFVKKNGIATRSEYQFVGRQGE